MTSPSVSNLIDIESPDFNSQLQFQDFSSSIPSEPPKTLNLSTSNYDNSINSTNLPNSGGFSSEESVVKSFWTWEYFQQFFNVTTDVVVGRIKGSIIPKIGVNYLQEHISNNPDLYGPVWVCITLIFSIAISGNIANYFQAEASHVYHWRYNFRAVTYAASAVISYAWVLPTILWAYLKYQGQQDILKITLLELLCIYGYSLSIYIPISVLWLIRHVLIQWLLVGAGAAMSGYILLVSISPALGRNYILLGILTALHFLLAVGFKVHFFHIPPMAYHPKASTPLSVAASVASVVSSGNATAH